MQSLVKFQWCLYRSRKHTPKIYMDPQKTPNRLRNPKNKTEGITLPDLTKQYGIGVQTDNRPMEQN